MIAFGINTAKSDTLAEVLDRYIYLIADGDKSSLGILYEETRSAVYGFTLPIVKNPIDAEDILQDVYVHIYLGAKSYKSRGKPMAWILTITRNLALMKIRDQNRATPLSPEDMSYIRQPAVTEEDRMVLRAMLNGLNDEERQIVVLHSLTGLKHREIAALLSIPLSTVLSKYNRSIKKLRKILKEEEANGR